MFSQSENESCELWGELLDRKRKRKRKRERSCTHHQVIKKCHTMIMSKEGTKKEAASMPDCSRCAAAFAALRLASAA